MFFKLLILINSLQIILIKFLRYRTENVPERRKTRTGINLCCDPVGPKLVPFPCISIQQYVFTRKRRKFSISYLSSLWLVKFSGVHKSSETRKYIYLFAICIKFYVCNRQGIHNMVISCSTTPPWTLAIILWPLKARATKWQWMTERIAAVALSLCPCDTINDQVE